MANVRQLKDHGAPIFPITHVSLVKGMEYRALMDATYAWDGTGTPDVSKIPAGVVVTYDGTDYTGTLVASASTTGRFYLVPSTTVQGEWDRYMTDGSGSSYAWKAAGNTSIPSPAVVDNETTDDPTKPHSAAGGKRLKDQLGELEAKEDYKTSRIPGDLYTNLFNKNDIDIQTGYYVNYLTGGLSVNANYNASGYIPVHEGKDYYRTQRFQTAWYDKDKVFISGINGGSVIETAPADAAYIRCSFQSADTFMVAESSVIIPYIEYARIKEEALPVSYKTFLREKVGKNLLDTAQFEVGYLGSTGTINANVSYKTSGYIPVIAGETYCISDIKLFLTGTPYICFYDSNKQFVSSIQSTTDYNKTVTIPTGCAFMRFSMLASYTEKPQVEIGNKRTTYSPYSVIGGYIPEVKKETIYDSAIVDSSVDGNKILEKSITIDNIGAITSRNLLNIKDDGVQLGKYVSSITGGLVENANYNTTALIRVESGKSYYIGKNGVALSCRFYAFFDRYNLFVSGGEYANTFSVPSGVAFVQFSIGVADWANNPHLNIGVLGKFTPFQLELPTSVLAARPAMSSLGNVASVKKASTLSSGSSLTDNDFPYYQLKGIAMSFSCNLVSIGTATIDVGKGYQQRLGVYLRIDATNIQLIKCNLSGVESVADTASHGLSISTFLRVSILDIGDGQVTYAITTIDGMFTKTVSWGYSGDNAAFARTTISLTNAVLVSASRELKRPVWCFGDSYMSVSNDRWVGVAKNIGVFGFMLNAISGGNSTNMIADAKRAFFFGTPKFAVWGIGMNDGSDTDSSTPSTSWLNAIQEFISLCEQEGTTPILATIPNVPSINHEGKNSWVKASGYRYIDFAGAVGANTYTSGVSNWYTDALSSDNVHPTALGAKMLASQVLIDFPEIMQSL